MLGNICNRFVNYILPNLRIYMNYRKTYLYQAKEGMTYDIR